MTVDLLPAFSIPSTFDTGRGNGNGNVVHHGYSTAKADLFDVTRRWDQTDDAVKAWWTRLDPGGFIVPHIDQGPWQERWHFPSSGAGYIWQESDEDGALYPRHSSYAVKHWQPHAVWNPFDEPRVILIVEYDLPIDHPSSDLVICDMIPAVQELIDAL